jgi:hypothetical protein
MEVGEARWPTVGLCGLPPIEQKTLDGWGTQFHPPRVGEGRWTTDTKQVDLLFTRYFLAALLSTGFAAGALCSGARA